MSTYQRVLGLMLDFSSRHVDVSHQGHVQTSLTGVAQVVFAGVACSICTHTHWNSMIHYFSYMYFNY